MSDLTDALAPASSRPLPAAIPVPPPEDPWLKRMVPRVELAIDDLVRSYARHPFLHRVEHSLHAQLYKLLTAIPELDETYELGSTGYRTGLVHKEWPETVGRPSKAKNGRPARRGNFDLAILAPSQLPAVSSLDQFTRGTIAAPIVIELGLGYDEEHLTGDIEKLESSQVPHPYLVHFSHVRSSKHALTERAVLGLKPPLQIAYVRHEIDTGRVHRKDRMDSSIGTEPRSG